MRELPEGVEYYVWSLYFKEVISEIERKCICPTFIWMNASKKLKTLIEQENGAYQHSHSDLEDLIEDHKLIHLQSPNHCLGCAMVGYFPCPVCKQELFSNQIECKFIF